VEVAAFGLIALVLSGCISHEQTVYREEPRLKVTFENEAAGRMFYEGLGRMPADRGRSESTTHVSIPIVFDHRERIIRGENSAFNNAVRRCDTNGDGCITEQEAKIFVESRR